MAKKKMTAVEYILKNHTVEGAPNFTIKSYLSPVEQLFFVDDIVDVVISDGHYYPALFNYALRDATMRRFTDLDIPDGNDLVNELAYDSDLYASIVAKVHEEHYYSLVRAAQEKIHYLASDVSGALVRWINEIGGALKEKIGTINFTEDDMVLLKQFADKVTNVDERTLAHALADISKKI